MENEENVVPNLDLARVQTVALKVMDYLDLLAEDGFDEVEIVTAMFLIGAKLSETMEEVVKNGDN